MRWRIALEHYGKNGGKAALTATSDSGRSGQFAAGRVRVVETTLGQSFTVPIGTVRHRIAVALIADGRAVAVPEEESDFPWMR